MTESPEDYELFHYGVKGMRWGVRKKSNNGVSATNPSAKRKYEDLSKREARKARRIDSTNAIKNYNKAADWANEELIPSINKKYKNVKIEDAKGNTTKAGEKYLKEYNDLFNAKLYEISSDTIREKTKGRINLDLSD